MAKQARLKFTEWHRQLLIKLVVMTGLLAAGWYLAVKPIMARFITIDRSMRQSRERASLMSDVETLQGQLKKIEKSLSQEKDRTMLLGDITKLAKRHGIIVSSLAPSDNDEGTYIRVNLEIKAQASFPDYARFILDLEKEKPELEIIATNFGASTMRFSSGTGLSDFSLSLQTILRKERL
jgi:Tfp pilus assembly protein PilO